MDIKHKQSIVDICDQLIEDAQTTLMNQIEHTNVITFQLSDYIDSYDEETKQINKAIIDHLMLQEIRLYEDACDENGVIVNSKELYSRIYDNVSIVSENNITYINLFYSQGMMDLLT